MRDRLVAVIAALTAAALLWTLPAPVADARNPPPPASLATPAIDAHLGYKPQSRCAPRAKPGAVALLKALIATWGGGSSGISRACSVGATSEHKEGRALDWHMDMKSASQRARVRQATDWLTANNGEVAYRLGVMYVIWNQHIWSLYYPELGWRKMANRGSYTANHKNHVHISLSWDGAYQQTSWWTGVPVTAPLNSRCGDGAVRACLPRVARTSKSWPYQQTVVPASFLPAPWTTPGIGGSPQVGRTLTAVAGTWVPDGAEVSYQWSAGSTELAEATGRTLAVTADLIGRPVRVRVTATAGEVVTSRTSDGTTGVVPARFTTTPTPTITGEAVTDGLVTVDPGAWAAAPESLTITWKRNGTPITGARGVGLDSYTPSPSDAGQRLTVTVTARRPGFVPTSRTSPAVKVARAPFTATPTPAITGNPLVGATLTAIPGAWVPEPAKLRYRWYAGGRAIKGATGATYRPTAGRVGKAIVVRVTASRPGYTTTSVTSEPVTIAAAP